MPPILPQPIEAMLIAAGLTSPQIALDALIYELGERLIRDDQCEQFDPKYRRQLNVFQLGWR